MGVNASCRSALIEEIERRDRSEKETREKFFHMNDNSLMWDEWAKRSPDAARDICLEAEYFYGDGNILPKVWAPVLEKWEEAARGDALIDEGSYQPKIYDEQETGPTRM